MNCLFARSRLPLALYLALALGCGPVMADWVRVSNSEAAVFYIDSSMPTKAGGNVMLWVLRDYKEAQTGVAGPFQSSKDQMEVDCEAHRIRRIFSSDHPRAMGEGKPVHSEYGPMSWNLAQPNTIVKRIVDIACR